MSRYIKKRVEVDAKRWWKHGDNQYVRRHVLEDGITEITWGMSICPVCGKTRNEHGEIHTLEGDHIVCPGDWIITGVKGERYPCKGDIFRLTYEPVSTEDTEEDFPFGKPVRVMLGCPSCGLDKAYTTQGFRDERWGVYCPSCGFCISGFDKERDAVKRWNTLLVAVVCGLPPEKCNLDILKY